ncbi:MAG: hypothetical protein LBN96_05645 [Desulfovibrio sp.]|nr:hypothetical protein [Desulfovibrio sp.]
MAWGWSLVIARYSVTLFSIPAKILRERPDKKTFAVLAGGILDLVLGGYLLLFAVSLLPQESLRQNILRMDSGGFFSENYPEYSWLRPLSNRLDMFTECAGVGIAGSDQHRQGGTKKR